MKRYLTLIIIFTGTIFCLYSQESEKKTNFSPEITLSYNYVNKNLLDAHGFGAGMYNVFFNQKRFNLITGLEYNMVFRNMVLLGNDYGGHYHYIGIPANARVNFGKKVKFFIEAGVFFDPIVIEKRRTHEQNISTSRKTTYIHKPDFGISGGIGLRIPIKEYELLLKSDYKWGMKHLYDFSLIAGYNNYLRFTVGFKVNFTQKTSMRKKTKNNGQHVEDDGAAEDRK